MAVNSTISVENVARSNGKPDSEVNISRNERLITRSIGQWAQYQYIDCLPICVNGHRPRPRAVSVKFVNGKLLSIYSKIVPYIFLPNF